MQTQVLVCVSQQGLPKSFTMALSEALARLKMKPGQLVESAQGPFSVLQLRAQCDAPPSVDRVRTVLAPLSQSYAVDYLCQPEEKFRVPKKLIAFDMDSTLIQAEVIDEMARAFGVGDQVKKVTERAMNGEMDFDQSLRERLSLVRGLEREKLESIFNEIKFTPGTEALLKLVHQHGIKTAIVSGGFSFFAEKFRQKLGMTYAFANELDFDGNRISGTVRGDILNAQKKVQIVHDLATTLGIRMDEVAAVGDGANDLPMLASVGTGVAIHGKERVRREAPHLINHGPMTTLAFYLGIPYADV